MKQDYRALENHQIYLQNMPSMVSLQFTWSMGIVIYPFGYLGKLWLSGLNNSSLPRSSVSPQ